MSRNLRSLVFLGLAILAALALSTFIAGKAVGIRQADRMLEPSRSADFRSGDGTPAVAENATQSVLYTSPGRNWSITEGTLLSGVCELVTFANSAVFTGGFLALDIYSGTMDKYRPSALLIISSSIELDGDDIRATFDKYGNFTLPPDENRKLIWAASSGPASIEGLLEKYGVKRQPEVEPLPLGLFVYKEASGSGPPPPGEEDTPLESPYLVESTATSFSGFQYVIVDFLAMNPEVRQALMDKRCFIVMEFREGESKRDDLLIP